MNYLPSFKLWLQTKQYTPTTIRNYIADINKYLRFTSASNSKFINKGDLYTFSNSLLEGYITRTANKKNHSRYFTSLYQFCQFAYEQKIIAENPIKKIKKQILHNRNTSLDSLLQVYQSHLSNRKKTIATIKNYINDVQQFIDWIQPPKKI